MPWAGVLVGWCADGRNQASAWVVWGIMVAAPTTRLPTKWGACGNDSKRDYRWLHKPNTPCIQERSGDKHLAAGYNDHTLQHTQQTPGEHLDTEQLPPMLAPAPRRRTAPGLAAQCRTRHQPRPVRNSRLTPTGAKQCGMAASTAMTATMIHHRACQTQQRQNGVLVTTKGLCHWSVKPSPRVVDFFPAVDPRPCQ